MSTQHDELLTMAEVAALLKVGRATIYRTLIPSGELRPIKVGGSVRFRRSDIDALLARGAA